MNKVLASILFLLCFAGSLVGQKDYRDAFTGRYIGQERETDRNEEPISDWSESIIWVYKSPYDTISILVVQEYYTQQEVNSFDKRTFTELVKSDSTYDNGSGHFGKFYDLDSIRDMGGTMIAPGTPGYREFKGAHERTVGIAEQRLNTVLLYPNPAKQLLYISGLMQQVNYTVYNLTGELLQQGSAKDNIAVGRLQPGTYLLELQFGKNRAIRRFIKE